MENVWQWGIEVIIVIQKIRSPFFDAFFKSVSSCGTEFFYMLLIPWLYWAYDKKTGARIFILFLISGWLNSVLKDIINHPRPYNLNAAVKIGNTGGAGIPSGHAQHSLVVWGALSLHRKSRLFTLAAIFVILIIAFSRIYLGVHFPTDILGGWIIGAAVLMIIWPLFERVEKILSGINPVIAAAVSVVIPVLFALVYPSRSSVMSMGALSGFTAGLILEKKFIGFENAGSFKAGFIRYISGIAVLMILYSAVKLLPGNGDRYFLVMRYIHSAVICIIVSAGAPWFFKKYRL